MDQIGAQGSNSPLAMSALGFKLGQHGQYADNDMLMM